MEAKEEQCDEMRSLCVQSDLVCFLWQSVESRRDEEEEAFRISPFCNLMSQRVALSWLFASKHSLPL